MKISELPSEVAAVRRWPPSAWLLAILFLLALTTWAAAQTAVSETIKSVMTPEGRRRPSEPPGEMRGAPPAGMTHVDLAWGLLSKEGDYEKDCLPRENGFEIRVRSRSGTGGGAFAGCCVTLGQPKAWSRAWVRIDAKRKENLLHVKLETAGGEKQDRIYQSTWIGSGSVQGEAMVLRDIPAAKLCVMAVGPNQDIENEITVSDLHLQ